MKTKQYIFGQIDNLGRVQSGDQMHELVDWKREGYPLRDEVTGKPLTVRSVPVLAVVYETFEARVF